MNSQPSAKMKPADRHAWIREWIQKNGGVDVLNNDFVSAYVEATGASFEALGFGADRCRQLGRDLSVLFQQKSLQRSRVGLTAHYTGMPNWVYVYEL